MNTHVPPPTRYPGRPASLPPGIDARSAAVLREIVEQYVETGEPVGSRTLSRRLPMNLSPATIRNVMADLTDTGLLYAPHTSAGRLPTDLGLRLFVDGLLQFGELSDDERGSISAAWRRQAAAWRTRWPTPVRCCPGYQPPPASCWRRRPRARCATSNSCRSAQVARWWCWWRPMGTWRTASSRCRRACRRPLCSRRAIT